MRGATKAVALTDDPKVPDLVAFSVYDTKPVNFLSMACMGLKWIEKRKFDVQEAKLLVCPF
jgi:hypothetical protein